MRFGADTAGLKKGAGDAQQTISDLSARLKLAFGSVDTKAIQNGLEGISVASRKAATLAQLFPTDKI